jgi:hypothetical protein
MFAQLYLLPIFHLCSLLAAKLGHKCQLIGRIFLILIKEERKIRISKLKQFLLNVLIKSN